MENIEEGIARLRNRALRAGFSHHVFHQWLVKPHPEFGYDIPVNHMDMALDIFTVRRFKESLLANYVAEPRMNDKEVIKQLKEMAIAGGLSETQATMWLTTPNKMLDHCCPIDEPRAAVEVLRQYLLRLT